MIFFIFASLFTLVICEENNPCVTPNGENAFCVPINSCKVIKDAIAYLKPDAIEFAKKSQCGYDNSPRVCCGSVGRATTPAPVYDESVPIPTVPLRPPVDPSISPIENTKLPDTTLCGIQIKQKDNRIFGGSVTDIDEFPWMVALKYQSDDGSPGGFRCGGTLINTRFVLTAAQCVNIKGFNLTHVRLGEWKFSTDVDCIQDSDDEEVCSDPVMDVVVIKKIIHPYYSIQSGNNDIALLQLEKKIKYTEYIRPICLPPYDLLEPLPGTPVDISGWGITEEGTQSDVKLKVQIPMVSNAECRNVFTNYTHINPNQACAGGQEGKDACHGDSGGPLMATYIKKDPTEEDQWYQEGIIYRGIGCGRKGVPSLYTRVSRYANWILNKIE